MTRLTARRLNRATLARQLLLAREPLAAAGAVRRVVALQAQEPASPYLALWTRVFGFDARDLDAAFANRTVVKASLMRVTLHAVHVEDYAPFHAAMQRTLRASRLGDRRFTSSGLSIPDADALVPDLLAYASEPRTNAQVEAWLAGHGVGGARWAWWALRTYAPLFHAPVGGPWSFGPRPAYVASDGRAPVGHPDEAVAWLVRRYLEGFGPASIPDVAQFALLRRPMVREALSSLGDALVELEGPDGKPLFDVAGASLPDEDVTPPPRLLPMWDSTLLAYHDRSRLIPAEYRRLVIRQNGDVLPTLLVDGYVAGVWRPIDGAIEATAFHHLSEEAWDGLAAEAEAVLAFLRQRDETVYRRYGRWWQTLSGAETRLLARRSEA